MGHKVPWKTRVLICHPMTSRPLIFLQKGAVSSPCDCTTTHLTAFHSALSSPCAIWLQKMAGEFSMPSDGITYQNSSSLEYFMLRSYPGSQGISRHDLTKVRDYMRNAWYEWKAAMVYQELGNMTWPSCWSFECLWRHEWTWVVDCCRLFKHIVWTCQNFKQLRDTSELNFSNLRDYADFGGVELLVFPLVG